MEHSALVFTIWQIEWQEMDLPISFHWCKFVLSLNGVFINRSWACIKRQCLTLSRPLEIRINVLCYLVRCSLVSCRSVGKALHRSVAAKNAAVTDNSDFHIVPPFFPLKCGLWPFSWFLSENFMCYHWRVIRKHQCDNHLGFAEIFVKFPSWN